MKIVQDLRDGSIRIELKQDEVYDIEEYLNVLMKFVAQQATVNFALKSSFHKISERLSSLKTKINQLSKGGQL